MPFDPEQQKIYDYYDGTVDEDGKYRIRRGDPMVIYRRIVDFIGGEEALSELWSKAHSPKSPTLRQDRAKLAELTRAAFELKGVGYGPGGLTEDSTFEILYDFSAWQKKSEKSTDGSLNISQPIPVSSSPSKTSAMTPTAACG